MRERPVPLPREAPARCARLVPDSEVRKEAFLARPLLEVGKSVIDK